MISVVADVFALGNYLSEGLVTARGGDLGPVIMQRGDVAKKGMPLISSCLLNPHCVGPKCTTIVWTHHWKPPRVTAEQQCTQCLFL